MKNRTLFPSPGPERERYLARLAERVHEYEAQASSGAVGFHAGTIPPGRRFRPGSVFLAHTIDEAEAWRDHVCCPHLHLVQNSCRNIYFIRSGKQYRDLRVKSGAPWVKSGNILDGNIMMFRYIQAHFGQVCSVVVTKKAYMEYGRYVTDLQIETEVPPHWAEFTVILDSRYAQIEKSFPEGYRWTGF